jgi:hypothetical protein
LPNSDQKNGEEFPALLADKKAQSLDLKGLDSWDDETLTKWEASIRERQIKHLSAGVRSDSSRRPEINNESKIIILPSYLNEEDNLLGNLLGSLAKKLGYRILKYEKSNPISEELPSDIENFIIGLTFIDFDTDRHINLSVRKDDLIERARMLVRAQQVIGLFQEKGSLGLEALRKNHYFFGNNPGETKMIRNKPVPVLYHTIEYSDLFGRDEEGKTLTNLFFLLTRKSHSLLSEEVSRKIVENHAMSFNEALMAYGTRSIADISMSKKGSKKFTSMKKKQVPKKPDTSSLLTRGENRSIDHISADLFKNPSYSKNEDWKDSLYKGTIRFFEEKKLIEHNSARRAEFRQNFASLTTKRLTMMRRLKIISDATRKANVKIEDLERYLGRKDDPILEFQNEIIQFDRTFSGCLAHLHNARIIGKQVSDESQRPVIFIKETTELELSNDEVYCKLIKDEKNLVDSEYLNFSALYGTIDEEEAKLKVDQEEGKNPLIGNSGKPKVFPKLGDSSRSKKREFVEAKALAKTPKKV